MSEGDPRGILLDFVDLDGIPRGTVVPADRYDGKSDLDAGFAGMVLDVFETRTDRGLTHPIAYGPSSEEARAVPDPDSAVSLPWTDGDLRNVRCSLYQSNEPLSTCPRNTLRSVLTTVEEHTGFTVKAGSEIEYTVLDSEGDRSTPPTSETRPVSLANIELPTAPEVADAAVSRPRPYDARPLSRASEYVLDISETAGEMGVRVEAIQRESAPGQYEASLDYHPALEHADHVISMRRALRAIGHDHDVETTFMPYPIDGYEGNGLHFHLSLHDGEEYAFADSDDDLQLSERGYQFIGGVLTHADGLTALCAPTINSYKRFQPGTFAPVDRAYGVENRTALVRLPRTNPTETRIEVRLADSYANPYLALAGIIAAGLDGLDNDRHPGPPSDDDRYGAEDDTAPLPDSLGDAIEALEADDVLVEALGADLVDLFCKRKRGELRRYADSVTDWELQEYVDKL